VMVVQVPAGMAVRKYTTEAAYWDSARNAWVYPGRLGDDFGGTGNTRIEGAARLKFSATATRWRIHVRAVDPPGSWGPWREFTWQAGAAESAGPTTAPAAASSATLPGSVPSKAIPPSLPPADKAAKIAELVAECDKSIAEAKSQISALDVEIATARTLIQTLEEDLKKTEMAMADASKQGAPPLQIASFYKHMQAINDTIKLTMAKIKIYEDQIKALEVLILKAQKEKAELLKL
jgi:hypothetical protein